MQVLNPLAIGNVAFSTGNVFEVADELDENEPSFRYPHSQASPGLRPPIHE
jgi:hypothetical protein